MIFGYYYSILNYHSTTGSGLLDLETLLTGIAIFLARVVDVTLGTVRTISIVQGRIETAFVLGFLEVSIWLMVITTVVDKVKDKPVLGIFYALGFSTGNAVGIVLEKKLSIGHAVLKIISPRSSQKMAEQIRELGYAVTTFAGEGISGPVTELCIVCKKSNLKGIVSTVKKIDPDAFYIIEHVGSVSKLTHPSLQQPTGWRAIFKKK
ncbi:MAG: DUF5698 domain-containing protein [bacterium]